MKILYGARFLRYDLLWPLASVARQISKWNKASDRRLHRLVSYLDTTIDYSLEAFVGDDPEDCVVLATPALRMISASLSLHLVAILQLLAQTLLCLSLRSQTDKGQLVAAPQKRK